MDLLELILENELYIDFGTEIRCRDNEKSNGSSVSPILDFRLMSTLILDGIADRIRINRHEGLMPMWLIDGFKEADCDSNIWYDFHVGVQASEGRCLEISLWFKVINAQSKDNEQTYTIDLNIFEQACICCRIEEQCRKHLGKGIEEMIAEASASEVQFFSVGV